MPITLQAGYESWLTLRDDGAFTLTGAPASVSVVHVLVQDMYGTPSPNIVVNVIPVAGGPLAGEGTTDLSGMIDFAVSAVNITFTVSSAGNGTVSPQGAQSFPVDSIQTFKPTPASGYKFDHWVLLNSAGQQNPDAGNQNPLNVKMVVGNDGATLTAYFVPAGGGVGIVWLFAAAVGVGAAIYYIWKA